MRYRYVTNGCFNPDEPISNYRLVGGNQIGNQIQVARIHIPDDMKLEKWSCDNYSTTEDKRTANELGYDLLLRVDGCWKSFESLKQFDREERDAFIRDIYELRPAGNSYRTPEAFKKWHKELEIAIEEKHRRIEKLKNDLDDGKELAENLRFLEGEILTGILDIYVKEKQPSRLSRLYWVSCVMLDCNNKPYHCAITDGCESLEEAKDVISKQRQEYTVLTAWVDVFNKVGKNIVFHEVYVDALGKIQQWGERDV